MSTLWPARARVGDLRTVPSAAISWCRCGLLQDRVSFSGKIPCPSAWSRASTRYASHRSCACSRSRCWARSHWDRVGPVSGRQAAATAPSSARTPAFRMAQTCGFRGARQRGGLRPARCGPSGRTGTRHRGSRGACRSCRGRERLGQLVEVGVVRAVDEALVESAAVAVGEGPLAWCALGRRDGISEDVLRHGRPALPVYGATSRSRRDRLPGPGSAGRARGRPSRPFRSRRRSVQRRRRSARPV